MLEIDYKASERPLGRFAYPRAYPRGFEVTSLELNPKLVPLPTPLTILVPLKALLTPGGDADVIVFVTPFWVVDDDENEEACNLLPLFDEVEFPLL